MLELQASSPFIFRDTLFAHGWLRLAPFHWDDTSMRLARLERLDDGRVVRLEMYSERPEALHDRVCVSVSGPPLTPMEERAVRERVRWMLALDEDLSAFHKFCRGIPGLHTARERRQGRFLRCPSVFEELIKTLCCVNARWAQSVNMARRLVEEYGSPWSEDPSLRAFPTAQQLAAADPEEAKLRCRLGYRTERMVSIARLEAEGRLQLENLRDPAILSVTVYESLLTLPGVGPYAAGHMLFLLGHYDVLPLDSWVRVTATKGWFGGAAVPDREIVAAFQRFHPYQTLVYQFLDWKGANCGFADQVNTPG